MSTVDCIALEHLDRGIHHFDCSGLAEVLLKSTWIAAAHQDLPVLHWSCFLTKVDFTTLYLRLLISAYGQAMVILFCTWCGTLLMPVIFLTKELLPPIRGAVDILLPVIFLTEEQSFYSRSGGHSAWLKSGHVDEHQVGGSRAEEDIPQWEAGRIWRGIGNTFRFAIPI